MSETPTNPSEMPFTEHLAELRDRIIKSLLCILVASVICFAWAEPLFMFLTDPLYDALDAINRSLSEKDKQVVFKFIGTGPAEAFIVKLKVAIGAGILLASPLLFYQLWQFIVPALHKHEQRFAVPFVFFSTVFFLAGASFCFIVVLPFAFNFFLKEYASIGVAPDLKIGEYLSFTIRILLIFGLVFELPVFSYFLARMRLLTHRWLLNKGRYAIVGMFIVAAMLTPPDVITQCLLAVPLLVLYAICIAVTYLAYPKEK